MTGDGRTGDGLTGGPVDPASEPVPTEGWADAVRAASAEGFGWFDHLSAVDEGDGRVSVTVHLWDRGRRRHRFLRTVTADGRLPSVAEVFPGAGWHEREAAEMFGLAFLGAPDSRPLLLPDGFAGHPLRKDFPLAARGAVEWPGAHEPTEHGPAARAPGRRRPVAPGVPEAPRPGAGSPSPSEQSEQSEQSESQSESESGSGRG